MILSRFFKPKWQRTDPETRKQGLLRGLEKSDPTTLRTLARQDPDPEIRRAALEKLDDLVLLPVVAIEDADATVRAAATARYCALLAGEVANGPTLAVRLERLERDLDPELREYLLQKAVEPELRLALLQRIEAETALAQIAQHDAHFEVRLAALERVHTAALLEQIARQSRSRDKRVYRRARERLDALSSSQAQAVQCERLCLEMDNLRWDGESGSNAGRFPKLEQQWREQEAQAAPELRERYTQARARFLSERQASASRRNQRLELIATLTTRLEQLRQASEPSAELSLAVRYALEDAPVAWTTLGPPQSAEGRRLDAQFQQLIQETREQERVLHRTQDRAERLRALLQQAQTLLQQPSEVHESELKTLRQRWEALERPEARAMALELQQRFESLLDQLRARLQRQTQQCAQEWRELQALSSQLEATAAEGELQQATQLQEQIRHRLKHSIGLSRSQLATLEDRLQACTARLGELRDWRRWGTHQAREQLCISAEGLIQLEAAPTEIAQRIQQVRKAWKNLDHQEGAAPKGLWQRFNAACEHAYAPCQAYFATQAQERRQNLEKKQALCAQLADFEATTDWTQVDWREADRLRRHTHTQWRQLGPVDRAERKDLERRFQQLTRRLDQQLNAERERELHRRQQLIEQTRSLAENPNLRFAIEAVKKAQTVWNPTVKGSPRQEQALWKEFRAACDAVFDRRQAEHQAADSERQDHLRRKQALCAELEALAATDAEQLAAADARLQTIQQEWTTTGAVPKTEQPALDQRFAAALAEFARHQQDAHRSSVRAAFERLQQRARLCARLEALLPDPPLDLTTLLTEARETWEKLPAVPLPMLELLLPRFTAVIQALGDSESHATASAMHLSLLHTLEQQLERKQIWCICLEIVAGVESPPECTTLRMEYQVARLSASLAGGLVKSAALYDPLQLQERWCATGALPAAAEAALDARFLRALDAWRAREER